MQVVANNEANEVNSETSIATQIELKQKSLDDYKKEFDRLNSLFNKKRRFEYAFQRLDEFERDVYDKPDGEIESKEFRLIFASGTYNDKEAIKISNVEVIKEAITYMKAKIESQIKAIEKEIIVVC